MLTIYIWEHAGGLSRTWRPWDEAMHIDAAFFMFGRFGAGWIPFGRLNDKAKAEALLAIRRVTEKFGIEARVLYCKPPEGEE